MRQEERQRRDTAFKKENEALQQPHVPAIYERKAEVQIEIIEKEESIEYVNNVSEVEANLSSKDNIVAEILNTDSVEKKEELTKDSLEVENLTTNEKSKKKKNLPKE